MKKFFTSIFGYILIAISAICIATFIAWSRAPDMLASHLSKEIGVPVEIEDIEVGFSHFTIENFEIGNVPNGILAKAFSVETLDIEAPLTNYLNPQVVIESIQLDNVYLGLEFDSATSTQGNWTRIMSNLDKAASEDVPPSRRKRKSEQSTTQSSPSTPGRSVFIKELIINNISVDLLYVQGGGKVKKLPVIKQIVLKNISSEEGFPIDQLMNTVLGQMLKEVFIKQNLQNMLDTLLDQQSQLNDYIRPFRGLIK
ncbi:MAG: AsmA family protein [Chlamydiae bacterium]|nr:AsmA family protein [Chlamydiota bacterium]